MTTAYSKLDNRTVWHSKMDNRTVWMPLKENILELDRKKICADANVLKRMAYMDKMNIWNGHENITR